MNPRRLISAAALSLAALTSAQEPEEAGHMHGPDGRHIAVASTFGAGPGKQILSHHDLRIEGADGKSVLGADVHSVIHKRGDANAVSHREHNTYEPENEVYGSHMMYKEPGEYTIVEKVTLPDKRELTVEFPIWVPAPAGATTATEEEHHHGPNWLFVIGGPLLAIGLLYAAYRAGRKSAGAVGAVLILALGSVPAAAWAQDEEAGHMHGPDGRHIAVASTFGGGGAMPLKAFPTAELKESATKKVGDIEFTLSIENEELDIDPNVVQMGADQAKTVGLQTVAAETMAGTNSLVVTGQVRPNPNGVITVNARVPGRVVEVGVTPGERIAAGAMVAVIESGDVVEAQADLRRSQAESASARAGFTRAQTEVQAANTRLENAEAVLQRQRRLAREGAFANPAVETVRARIAEVEGEIEEARSALQNLEATARRLRQGVETGVVARNEAERAESAAAQGRTRLSTAERQLVIAKETLTREQRIQGQGLRNAAEIQQAEADVRVARSGVLTARSQLAQARAEQVRVGAAVQSAQARIQQLGAGSSGGRVTVRSAIGGEVESRAVNVGQTVSEGQVLAQVLNADSLWIEGDVFERDLPKVQIGQSVRVVADAVPGRTFAGVVQYIGGVVNPESRAVRVRTVVKQTDEVLKPNMFARVILAGGGERMVAVPAAAIQEDGGAQIVFVEAEPGSYRRTAVQISSTLGERVLVASGLKPGEKVVTQGAYQLLAKAKGG